MLLTKNNRTKAVARTMLGKKMHDQYLDQLLETFQTNKSKFYRKSTDDSKTLERTQSHLFLSFGL